MVSSDHSFASDESFDSEEMECSLAPNPGATIYGKSHCTCSAWRKHSLELDMLQDTISLQIAEAMAKLRFDIMQIVSEHYKSQASGDLPRHIDSHVSDIDATVVKPTTVIPSAPSCSPSLLKNCCDHQNVHAEQTETSPSHSLLQQNKCAADTVEESLPKSEHHISTFRSLSDAFSQAQAHHFNSQIAHGDSLQHLSHQLETTPRATDVKEPLTNTSHHRILTANSNVLSGDTLQHLVPSPQSIYQTVQSKGYNTCGIRRAWFQNETFTSDSTDNIESADSNKVLRKDESGVLTAVAGTSTSAPTNQPNPLIASSEESGSCSSHFMRQFEIMTLGTSTGEALADQSLHQTKQKTGTSCKSRISSSLRKTTAVNQSNHQLSSKGNKTCSSFFSSHRNEISLTCGTSKETTLNLLLQQQNKNTKNILFDIPFTTSTSSAADITAKNDFVSAKKKVKNHRQCHKRANGKRCKNMSKTGTLFCELHS